MDPGNLGIGWKLKINNSFPPVLSHQKHPNDRVNKSEVSKNTTLYTETSDLDVPSFSGSNPFLKSKSVGPPANNKTRENTDFSV